MAASPGDAADEDHDYYDDRYPGSWMPSGRWEHGRRASMRDAIMVMLVARHRSRCDVSSRSTVLSRPAAEQYLVAPAVLLAVLRIYHPELSISTDSLLALQQLLSDAERQLFAAVPDTDRDSGYSPGALEAAVRAMMPPTLAESVITAAAAQLREEVTTRSAPPKPEDPGQLFLVALLQSVAAMVLRPAGCHARDLGLAQVDSNCIFHAVRSGPELSEFFPERIFGTKPTEVLAAVPTELWELILDCVIAPTGVFVVSGAHGYAEGINGTYQPVRYLDGPYSSTKTRKLIEEFHDGYNGLHVGRDPRIIYRQLENPLLRFKRLAPCDETLVNPDRYSHLEGEPLKTMHSGLKFGGWVATWAQPGRHSKYKCLMNRFPESREGYLRSTDPDALNPAAAKRGTWEIVDLRGEIQQFAESWILEGSGWDDYPPPFGSASEVVVRLARYADLNTAARERAARRAHIAEVASAPVPLVVRQGYLFSGVLQGPDMVWYPVRAPPGSGEQWLLHDNRPVYSLSPDSGKRRPKHGELKYNGADGRWELCLHLTGESRCWSVRGCDAASPVDVRGWEYDDGHYATWGLCDKIRFSEYC